MDVDAALATMATTRGRLPSESIRWALDHWDETAPRLLDALDRYLAGDDMSEDAETLLFLAIHMLAEKRETAAFEPFCRLLEDAEATESVLGDATGATLSQLLISLHNGDWQALKTLIEGAHIDEFVRHAALNTWAYFTSTGAIPLDETRRYLQALANTMQPQEPNYAWVGLADVMILLGLNDLRGIVEDLIRRKLILESDFDMEDFDSAMQRTLADPERRACFQDDHVYPFASTIDELSNWHWNVETESDGDDGDVDYERAAPAGPYMNPFRHVGRNDPCPCGSGKKYKKCCLN